MWKVKLSRKLNRLLGGNPKLMFSSQMYLRDKHQPIDILFYYLRGEEQHCRNCFYFDIGERNGR